jgi:hypothetical protein
VDEFTAEEIAEYLTWVDAQPAVDLDAFFKEMNDD